MGIADMGFDRWWESYGQFLGCCEREVALITWTKAQKEIQEKSLDYARQILGILDRTRSAEGCTSQLIWNDDYHEIRKILVFVVEKG